MNLLTYRKKTEGQNQINIRFRFQKTFWMRHVSILVLGIFHDDSFVLIHYVRKFSKNETWLAPVGAARARNFTTSHPNFMHFQTLIE
eukprot:UN00197